MDKAARIFKVLSDETRLRIIDLLKNQSLCVNALAHFLGVTNAAISQHLRILRDANLVIGEKKGYFVHYHINEETLSEWEVIAKNLFKKSTSKEDE
ncbi:ArsR/SmtB family transcription factor [Atribacter laminatus]|jgi:DNA-binding transcriptional ArsR family regulator|uniref:Transcriptional repressor SdpR n=1 Tax=Atribacter laminatus TaxID=2847778 RepID=A0A7T1AJA6_ATRLM|nr:metalloregulator ArsR/SmtB family transcription factor [Atribacter laminatus]QPM66954.1 Transcriptional repressor SdpR [Atribacter laminatus]